MLSQSEKILELISSPQYKPMKADELAFLTEVPSAQRHIFDNLLEDLEKEGKIAVTRKGKIMTPASLSLIPGVFTGNPRGYGFVLTDEPEPRYLFIASADLGDVMHKDRVLCRITEEASCDRHADGEIVKILKRGYETVVGTFHVVGGRRFVVPKEKRLWQEIPVSAKNCGGCVDGHIVTVKLGKENKVIEIIGHVNDPGMDVMSIVRQFGVPCYFPEEALAEARSIPQEVREDCVEACRRDLRQWDLITIDGEDTKDIDDAVSIDMDEQGNYILGVHIADVCHYVAEGSPLNREAYKRGTSIYLADRVIPMLPQELSNGICSLNENEDRLALSNVMVINKSGGVLEHDIFLSLIRVNKRLTYTEVDKMLSPEYPGDQYTPMLSRLNELREILLAKRLLRGSIDLDIPESKIIVDENGMPTDIKAYGRSNATGIIEECMLICNETVAEHFFWLDAPFAYRVHEESDPEKLKSLEGFVRNMGYKFRSARTNAVQELLSKIEHTPEEAVISKLVLRSFKQARYSNKNLGHFGLAAKYYCHFTSPIRRYPDLMVHRIIKKHILGDGYGDLEKSMPEICKSCSVAERTAEELERDVESLKKAQYMQRYIGEEYSAVISGLTSRGIYAELPNTVYGFISVRDLSGDYFVYDDKKMILAGARSGITYRLGDLIRVKVVRVDPEARQIDFILISTVG